MTVQFIDDTSALTTFCDAIADSVWIAVDTEFLREKTYFPQLCLIQVATQDHIACIDPIALDDLTPLMDVLYREGVTIVFHAARQDLEIFYIRIMRFVTLLFSSCLQVLFWLLPLRKLQLF